MEHFGHDHEFTKLVTDLKGKDPDDAFSSIPYEKGFNFLFHLENLVGKQKFDKFIPHVRPATNDPQGPRGTADLFSSISPPSKASLWTPMNSRLQSWTSSSQIQRHLGC